MAIKSESPILSVTEAAARLGLSPHSIRKYIQKGLIHPIATVGGVHLLTEEECDRYGRERKRVGNPTFQRAKKKRLNKRKK